MMLSLLLLFLATPAAAAPHCPSVTLAISGSKQFAKAYAPTSPAMRKTSANFAQAYKQACAAGMLKSRPLIPVNGANAGKLFLTNAPSANVASIYPGEGRMVLEYPFVDSHGKVGVPDAAELKEAIFCAVVGASDKEQEASGRCLPD
jgi:hypothetical protein